MSGYQRLLKAIVDDNAEEASIALEDGGFAIGDNDFECLMKAAENGSLEVLRVLVEDSAIYGYRWDYSRIFKEPMVIAAKHGHEHLLRYACFLASMNPQHMWLLESSATDIILAAASSNWTETIDFLINEAPLSIQQAFDSETLTAAIDVAVTESHLRMAQYLVLELPKLGVVPDVNSWSVELANKVEAATGKTARELSELYERVLNFRSVYSISGSELRDALDAAATKPSKGVGQR